MSRRGAARRSGSGRQWLTLTPRTAGCADRTDRLCVADALFEYVFDRAQALNDLAGRPVVRWCGVYVHGREDDPDVPRSAELRLKLGPRHGPMLHWDVFYDVAFKLVDVTPVGRPTGGRGSSDVTIKLYPPGVLSTVLFGGGAPGEQFRRFDGRGKPVYGAGDLVGVSPDSDSDSE